MKRLWRWLKNQIVQQAPKGMKYCEFVCRKEYRTAAKWEVCPNRFKSLSGLF